MVNFHRTTNSSRVSILTSALLNTETASSETYIIVNDYEIYSSITVEKSCRIIAETTTLSPPATFLLSFDNDYEENPTQNALSQIASFLELETCSVGIPIEKVLGKYERVNDVQ